MGKTKPRSNIRSRQAQLKTMREKRWRANNKAKKCVKIRFPKFDVANENDFDDLENSNSLFDEVGFQVSGFNFRFLIGSLN